MLPGFPRGNVPQRRHHLNGAWQNTYLHALEVDVGNQVGDFDDFRHDASASISQLALKPHARIATGRGRSVPRSAAGWSRQPSLCGHGVTQSAPWTDRHRADHDQRRRTCLGADRRAFAPGPRHQFMMCGGRFSDFSIRDPCMCEARDARDGSYGGLCSFAVYQLADGHGRSLESASFPRKRTNRFAAVRFPSRQALLRTVKSTMRRGMAGVRGTVDGLLVSRGARPYAFLGRFEAVLIGFTALAHASLCRALERPHVRQSHAATFRDVPARAGRTSAGACPAACAMICLTSRNSIDARWIAVSQSRRCVPSASVLPFFDDFKTLQFISVGRVDGRDRPMRFRNLSDIEPPV